MKKQEIYTSIETLPVKRWFEILKTGKLHHLYVAGSGATKDELFDVWLSLQQQYFDEFGVDDHFKIRIRKMQKLASLNCEFIITQNRGLLGHIKQLELEIEDNGKDKSVSAYKIKSQIEKYRKYAIDLDKTTVIEWYHMVSDFEEAGREAKKELLKQKTKSRGRN